MRVLQYRQTCTYGHLLFMVTSANSWQNHIPVRSAICCILLSSLIGDHLPITLLATCEPAQLCKLHCNQEPLWEGRIFSITLDALWLPNCTEKVICLTFECLFIYLSLKCTEVPPVGTINPENIFCPPLFHIKIPPVTISNGWINK